MLGLCVNYKNNMSGSYSYGGPEANSHIITDFMTPDFQYMKRSYYKLGGEVSYFTNISKNRKSGMFIKAALDTTNQPKEVIIDCSNLE